MARHGAPTAPAVRDIDKYTDEAAACTADGGNANRRVGPVRPPGTSQVLTSVRGEVKLREMMDRAHGRVAAAPKRTIENVGRLQRRVPGAGRQGFHVETFESHVRCTSRRSSARRRSTGSTRSISSG